MLFGAHRAVHSKYRYSVKDVANSSAHQRQTNKPRRVSRAALFAVNKARLLERSHRAVQRGAVRCLALRCVRLRTRLLYIAPSGGENVATRRTRLPWIPCERSFVPHSACDMQRQVTCTEKN